MMEELIDFVPSIRIFTVVMGVIGLVIGMSLLINAKGIVHFSRSLDKWVSVEQFVEKVDQKLLDMDAWMLKNNTVAAILFILLAILTLGLGLLVH